MKRTLIILVAVALAAKVQMKDLPPAVQKTVQAESQGAEIKGIAKETEKGQTVYELETLVNGKGRDLMIDSKGAVLSVEQEVSLDSIPAPAKAAIERLTAGGKISKVETLTKGGVTSYEAAFKKGGKSREVTVTAAGAEVKE